MNLRTLVKFFALSGAAMALGATPGIAAGGIHSQDVGGGVLTNFLDSTHTEGTSTGDIRDAIGVAILGVTPGPNGTTVYHVQHHWVTDSGDTILLKDAFLTAFPTTDPNRVLGDYLDGVEFIGGTGRFEGATGKAFVFGAADLGLGQITLRYAGTVCFEQVPRL